MYNFFWFYKFFKKLDMFNFIQLVVSLFLLNLQDVNKKSYCDAVYPGVWEKKCAESLDWYPFKK